MATIANLRVPEMVDPVPTTGQSGTLPSEALLEGGEAEGQSSQWSALPAQRPGTRSGFNQGVN